MPAHISSAVADLLKGDYVMVGRDWRAGYHAVEDVTNELRVGPSHVSPELAIAVEYL